MNNGIFIQDIFSKSGFDNKMPLGMTGTPMPVQLPYHCFGPSWKNNFSNFICIFDTSLSQNDTVSILLAGNGSQFYVDWGDGIVETYASFNNTTLSHTYNSKGIYIVNLVGNIFAPRVSSSSLIKIISFGNPTSTADYTSAFSSNANLIETPASLPATANTLQLSFSSCSKFNDPNVVSWNTASITNMRGTFLNCSSFNQPIGSWNISNNTSLDSTFNNCSAFNQNLNSWNTSNVTVMSSTFNLATSFNQPIGLWNTTKVTTMASMFNSASSFNQNIGSWNTSSVTDMGTMFYNNRSFNNGGSPSISGWNTSNVTNMNLMFYAATTFNQPVGSWNVSKVTNLSQMFNSAYAFNQDISSWNLAGLSSNTALDLFMSNKTGGYALSTANYDALLIGWNNNKLVGANGVANWRTDLRPDFGGAKYTAGGAAATARAALVSYGWTITDGGTA